MEKVSRYIYEIDLNIITEWNEEMEFPTDMDPVEIVDFNIPYSTANILDAINFFEKQKDIISEDEFLELVAREIDVTDEEWYKLVKKEKLEFSDYSDFIKTKELRTLAWNFSYKGHYDSDDSSALDELLVVQSENFNMRVICDRAGVSYSTYRGFKNNKQPFSVMKKIKLLRCMNEVGNMCWDKDLEQKYMYYLEKEL